jgi:hypothetical protein
MNSLGFARSVRYPSSRRVWSSATEGAFNMTRVGLRKCLIVAACLSALGADQPAGKEPAAADLLNAGLSKAKKDGTRVFLVFGSPGCGWCKIFDKYHTDPEVAKVLEKYLVLVKVDVVKNPGGEAMYNLYGSHRGVPAWSILDGDEKLLADSGDGQKNVGFPGRPHEIDHYVKALRKACPKLTDAEVELLTRKLKEVTPETAR